MYPELISLVCACVSSVQGLVVKMVTTPSQILAVLAAFLIGPASTTEGALTVGQAIRINAHPSTELALSCGDRTHTGEWMTSVANTMLHTTGWLVLGSLRHKDVG